MEDIIVKIKDMIADIQPYIEFGDTTNLWEEEVLDSMSLLLLVQELEEEYGIAIDVEEVNTENFADILHIAKLVVEKQKQ